MRNWKTGTLAGVVALALLTLSLWTSPKVEQWLAQREAWQQQAKEVTAANAILTAENQQLALRVTAFETAVEKRDTVIRRIVVERAATSVPDTCLTIVALGDSLIELLAQDTLDLTRALDEQKKHSANLQQQVTALEGLTAKADTVLRAAPVKPNLWTYLKPELRVTVGPGYDPLNKEIRPLMVTVGASWRLP